MESVIAKSQHLANQARLDVLEMIHKSHASHIASAFSVVDILAVLYSCIANINPNNTNDPNRDKIVLSKGHAGSALYAILAELEFFSLDELLSTYYQDGSRFSGHISHKNVPGVEVSTGSLGQGAGIACGLALSDKIHDINAKTYAVVGDGECQEGSIWEMAEFAQQQNLSNLVVIIDCNKMQAMGNCSSIVDMSLFKHKWQAFGWNAIDVIDGNSHSQLLDAFQSLDAFHPNAIIANTIKGYGVSFMENELLWHYRDPQGEFYSQAKEELTSRL